ncbi:MAG: amidohydrolase [Anaerolineales bacterium]|jgi:cytosine/adenosine deaminase-related metal-dependent hydrolase
MIDLMICNAQIITVDTQRRVFENGAIAIEGNKILEVGKSGELMQKYTARRVLDATHFIVMPGLINCHMHLPQVIMRGVNDNVEVMDKLKYYIWPIQGSYDEEDAYISTQLGLLEMIKAGTTAFLGTGLHPRYGIGAIAQAVIDSGIRGVISKYVMDQTGYALDKSALHPGLWENGEESLRMACDLIENWHGKGEGRLQVWFSPRSVGGVSEELFRRVSDLAKHYGVGITAHWAEVQNNADYTLERFGLLPAEYAQKVGMVGKNVTLVHGIYFEDRELDILAATQTNICHCPVCNAKLAMGTAKVTQMLHKGVNVCLGNDGMPVNNTADMFREMRTALLLQRNLYRDPLYPTAAEAIEMATINGAKGILAEDVVGSIETGKHADIILVNTRKPHLIPIHDPTSAIVWAANGEDVDTVIIDGKIIMENRHVLTMNEEDILEQAERRKHKILEQAGVKVNHVWKLQ